MEFESYWVVLITLCLGGFLALYGMLRRANEWYYETRLGEKRVSLPPGDLGWPVIGNMMSFLRAFKSSDPDTYTSNFAKRFNRIGIYKVFMYGTPTIMVTTPITCRQVLMDNEHFKSSWPKSIVELMGKKSFLNISYEEHKRLRRLTSSTINGVEALSMYTKYIEDVVISMLDEWANMGQIELLTQSKKLTFKIITHIFLSSNGNPLMEALEKEYTTLNNGLKVMAINIPGFSYYNALKARKKLVEILQGVLDERREMRTRIDASAKDMMDALIEVEDDKGRRLDDEEIIDVLILYLYAGHETSGHLIMWVIIFLQANPEIFKKARVEQVDIIRNRRSVHNGLTLVETRRMHYLSKVIDETLRVVNISSFVYREALTDVNLNGYTIPKGWKVQVWLRNVNLDLEAYPNPKEFNPSRWEGYTPKPRSYLPFGAGSRMCPGIDLTKLEVSIFLHHFLLNYEVELLNPDCPIRYLPHPSPKDRCLASIRKISSTPS